MMNHVSRTLVMRLLVSGLPLVCLVCHTYPVMGEIHHGSLPTGEQWCAEGADVVQPSTAPLLFGSQIRASIVTSTMLLAAGGAAPFLSWQREAPSAIPRSIKSYQLSHNYRI